MGNNCSHTASKSMKWASVINKDVHLSWASSWQEQYFIKNCCDINIKYKYVTFIIKYKCDKVQHTNQPIPRDLRGLLLVLYVLYHSSSWGYWIKIDGLNSSQIGNKSIRVEIWHYTWVRSFHWRNYGSHFTKRWLMGHICINMINSMQWRKWAIHCRFWVGNGFIQLR